MTQFPEVTLGEKRTHQFLIVARNSNTSQSSVPLLPKRIYLWLSVANNNKKKGEYNSQSSLIQQICVELLLCPRPSGDLHMIGA